MAQPRYSSSASCERLSKASRAKIVLTRVNMSRTEMLLIRLTTSAQVPARRYFAEAVARARAARRAVSAMAASRFC